MPLLGIDFAKAKIVLSYTWSQNLGLHPHLHCIIPAGGVDKNKQWKHTRSKGKYLFPAKIMASIFKAIFIKELKRMSKDKLIVLDEELKEKLYHKNWVVYAKKPFLNPAFVIEYLGRYSHKIAISNYRLIHADQNNITFSWKNYRLAGQTKPMELPIGEFVRRFALHILPKRFVRIRHFGILSFHGRKNTIPIIQKQQGFNPIISKANDESIIDKPRCIKCNSSNLIHTILARKTRAP